MSVEIWREWVENEPNKEEKCLIAEKGFKFTQDYKLGKTWIKLAKENGEKLEKLRTIVEEVMRIWIVDFQHSFDIWDQLLEIEKSLENNQR